MRYGFVGLGNLGSKLASSLLKSGFLVAVFDKDQSVLESLKLKGADVCDTVKQLSQCVDHVITCLPSPKVSFEVISEALPHMADGSSWIEMSTISREDVLQFSEQAKKHNVEMLELPVTGGVHLAAKGKITMLAGGSTHLFQLHHPALQAMGDKIFHIGPLGSAAIIKVITNMLAFIHLVADGEALMLARRGGLDLKTSWEAIKASSGTSFVHETEGQLILNGSYDIAFSMDLALKDLGFAMRFGSEFGVPLELASLVNQTFVKGKAAYGGSAQSTQVMLAVTKILRN